MPKSKIGRQSQKREQNTRFLVVSEGAVTEKQYIDAVKRSRKIRSVDLEFIPPGPTSPEEIVRRARDLYLQSKRDDAFDQVWCIFDVEAKVTQKCRPGLVTAIALAKKWNISLALSNPCIELWVLLHREDRQAWIDSHTCQSRCASLSLTDGKHLVSPDGLYQEYRNARKHAINLDEKHRRDGTYDPVDQNPSSALYELVDAICEAFVPRM